MTKHTSEPIVTWYVSRGGKEAERKEYARETAAYYVRADGRRDAKTSRWYQYFDTEEAAQAAIDERLADEQARKDRKAWEEAAINALAGIPNPAAVADVVETLRDARTTIVITRTNIMTEISRYSDASESRWAGVPEQLQKRIDNIDAALAKLGDGL